MTTTDVDLSLYYVDSVVSGLVLTQDTLLDGDITAGTAYITQALISVDAVVANGFTASKDTYVDVGNDGVVTYTETVIDAGAPALAADAIRLYKVVTDGTTITSIVDMRTLHIGTYTFVNLPMVGTAMEIYNAGNNPVYFRHGAASTSEGMPIAPRTSVTVAETVYIKPTGKNGKVLTTG